MIHAFYSDPHFGHAGTSSGGIIKLADRPFETIEEHDTWLIRRYNYFVRAEDTVLWLGDSFFWPFERTKQILDEMNGFKITLLGNHDRSAAWLARAGFLVVPKGEIILNIAGRTCRVSHYPYEHCDTQGEDVAKSWYPQKNKGEILIHGHTHKKEMVQDNMIHVGVDAWHYSPVLMAEVECIVGKYFPVKEEEE